MSFSKLLFVAYEVPTFFRTGVTQRQDEPSLLTRAVTDELLDPVPGSLREDLLARAAHLGRVLQFVQTALEPLPEDTLLVFMVPEFFFRHPARPYRSDEFFDWLNVLRGLSEKTPEWLVIPGTCWWSLSAHALASARDGAELMLNNTSIVLRGGRMLHSQINTLPPVVNGSHASGLELYVLRDEHGAIQMGAYLQSIWRLHGRVGLPWNRPLLLEEDELGGLRLGLEVGLDHVSGELAEELSPGDLGVDVHLLTSCGIPRLNLHVASRTGGCFLRCDGAFQEEVGSVRALASEAVRVSRRGERVEETERARVRHRLTEPVDSLGDRLRKSCLERRLMGPAVVIHEPLELLAK